MMLFYNPRQVGLSLLARIGPLLGDKAFLKIQYRLTMGKRLNLDSPQSFNEKLQWLKINNRKPEYTTMVDKYAVKDYVASVLGPQYIIPTIGVWDRAEDIEWDRLPNQFVLKCTHDSGGIVICKDKSKLDTDAAIEKLRKSLKKNYYNLGREWPYKNVPHRIIAEKFLIPDSETGDLPDYKFFCFNGKVKMCYIATGRQTGEVARIDFFDESFNHLPIKQGRHPNAAILPEKPAKFDEMKMLAEKLSIGIPHVRVDFYEHNRQILFGEMTFFSQNGTAKFIPEEWDYRIGEWLDINMVK